MEALLVLLHRKLEGQSHTYLCMESSLGPISVGQHQLNHTSLRIGTVTRPTRNSQQFTNQEYKPQKALAYHRSIAQDF
jgi:hypothetical protein